MTLPPFPDSERVVYNRNPLTEVICQLRFPPILRIAAEPPVAFQERIRAEYPLLTERSSDTNIEVPPGLPPAVAEMIRGSLPKRKLAAYDFVSTDGWWKVSLTRDFLSLSTGQYTRWEHFQDHLKGPLQALVVVYAPVFFTRVGLRYRNLIQRSRLELNSTKWSELIKPHVTGMHAVPDLEDAIEEWIGQILLNLPEFKSKVRIHHGIAQDAETSEDCFMIDNDFYTGERTEYDAVDGILGYFNKQSGRLFRSCIRPELDKVMEPFSVKATD